ncbi:DUF551 domain-containing protein [Escherichia coli]|nr:DUF551 domain-containing protein [Escherichia coli]
MITITKEFTKEQLIEQAKKNIEVLRVAVGRVPGAYDAAVIHLKLAEITLTSLEAEPVAVNDDMAYAFHHALSDSSLGSDEIEEIKTGLRAAFANVAVQPALIVPAEIEPDDSNTFDYVDGWNACRAAMLQSQNNGIKDGWISCSERMPNDKQYVWCWGKSYGWTECNTFEGYYDWSRNKWWAVTDDGEEPASKVTYWMQLPEPPQEVNQ